MLVVSDLVAMGAGRIGGRGELDCNQGGQQLGPTNFTARRESFRPLRAIICRLLDRHGQYHGHCASCHVLARRHQTAHYCALRRLSLQSSRPSPLDFVRHPGGRPRICQRRRSPELLAWPRAEQNCDRSIHMNKLRHSDGRQVVRRCVVSADLNDLYGYGCIGVKKPGEDARPRANEPTEVGKNHVAGIESRSA